jgi:hypothetical protein
MRIRSPWSFKIFAHQPLYYSNDDQFIFRNFLNSHPFFARPIICRLNLSVSAPPPCKQYAQRNRRWSSRRSKS